ncbi:GTP 3',8-cyclase MoaA [Thioalkalivibrio paradoxus]|uniref:GTP 3',8-cyclase n=1 Tax=Thioalkalivibrio paradoxus ARh 1 TaxID=713585 RepID=W0DK42_9GAMM|nr:GTP 3',8-cyclase MoaA [Thioalkalivibrio paradoxus]AHE97250.1 radical SAM protein [Thioalkalivibrio paradoxus ARh 1]
MATQRHGVPDRLIDRFGRQVTYVRLSVTDRCDFRCVYCMGERMTFIPRAQLLTLEEMATVGQAFVALGVRKLRITGGEPLVRRNVISLIRQLGRLPGLEELTLTTNGSQLERLARPLCDAGVKRINISLDSLDPQHFRRITRIGDLSKVLRGIDAALAAGFERIKLNTVAIRDRGDDEVLALLDFVLARDMDITFIEQMPAGVDDEALAPAFVSSAEVLDLIRSRHDVVATDETTGGPARYYRIPGKATRIGFISPRSHSFCERCNRVRVTTEGKLLLCLGQEQSVDLKQVLRAHPGDLIRLKRTIAAAMELKPRGHDFNLPQDRGVAVRPMSATGG